MGLDTKAGTYTVLKNVCPILMKKHEITILTNTNIDIDCHKLIQLKSWFFPLPKYSFMPGLITLVKSGKLDDYDVIHIFEYPLFATDYLTYKKNNIKTPIIISMHGSLHQSAKFPISIFKKIHNSIMLRYQNNISTFLASTMAEKSHIIKYGIPENKIKLLTLGVNIPKINRVEPSRKNILYLGRLAVTKNVDILLNAFSLLKNDETNLIIAGPDFGVLKKLKKITQDLGLKNKVFFKGRVSEKAKWELFAEATIFVHTSFEDVFSLALVEAASSGVPSIAFDVEANSEILENEVTGMLVKETSVISLKNTMELLLNNQELQNKISNQAKEIIPKKYNWNNTNITLEKYYSEIKMEKDV